MGNTIPSGNKLIAGILPRLAKRLPSGWQAVSVKSGRKRLGVSSDIDAILKVRGPGNATGSVVVEAKARIEPKDVDYLAATLRPTVDRPVLVVAPFLSPRTQERLRASGFGYADRTGNVRLTLSRPGLFIETSGASQDPEPSSRDRKSLKGAKAGRLIRALCDFRPPIGLRDLAKRAGFQLVVCTERKGVNRRANKMGVEHLMFFNKPAQTFGHTSKASKVRAR